MTEVLASGLPDPAEAADLADFIGLLDRLRVWGGDPSLRVLANRVGPLLHPPQPVSKSTIADMFQAGRRRLNQDLVVAVVRALGLDEQAVHQWRTACIRVHAEAKVGGPTGVFRQLPGELATFTGRSEELAQLLDMASGGEEAGGRTVVVTAIEGMGGVGKTQLAVQAAHELVRSGNFAEIQLYVNLRGFDPEQPPADPTAVLDAFLRQLEVPVQQIPASLDERAAMFRDRLHGRDVLILLDNAADQDQVRDLIPATSGCLVLITSRRTLAGLDGVHTCQLDVFRQAEAVRLLARIAGAERVDAEPDKAVQVVEICGRLPLAVALAAARLRTRPQWKLSDLLDHLHSLGLDAMAVGRRTLRPIFDLSYNSLPPGAQRFFTALGIFRGHDLTPATAAALAGVGIPQAKMLMELLDDEHLLQQPAPGRYAMHDLIRAYAAGRADRDTTPKERAESIARVASWYLRAADPAVAVVAPHRSHPPAFADLERVGELRPAAAVPAFDRHDEALAWLSTERGNLAITVQHAREAGLFQLTEALALVTTDFLATQSYWEDYSTVQQIRVDAARQRGDALAQAEALNSQARALLEGERFAEALDCGLAARELAEEAGSHRMHAATTETVALVHYCRKEQQEALGWFESAVKLRRADNYPFGLAATLNNLAGVYVELDRPNEAIEAHEEAIAICRAAELPLAVALMTTSYGMSLQQLGLYESALATTDDALDQWAALGDDRNRAIALENRAQIQNLLGRRDDAAASRAEAAQLKA